MFLRCKKRHKDGKEHSDWNIVENRRVIGGRILQRQVLYLGELNGGQEASWRRTVELFSHDQSASPTCDSCAPRQWGACWLGCELWQQLGLDAYWLDKLPHGHQGARWDLIANRWFSTASTNATTSF